MKAVLFHTPQDAALVAEQLYGVEQNENILLSQDLDERSLALSAGLAGVEYELVGAKCRLPFQPITCFKNTPQIYVACLTAYSIGHVFGMWIDATQEPEGIQEDIDYMLSWSPVAEHGHPCKEWAIHSQSNFKGITLGEYDSLEKVSRLGNAVYKYGQPFALFYACYGSDATEETFSQRYIGCYETEADFVREKLTEEKVIERVQLVGLDPEYIDYDKMARTWFFESYISGYEGCDKTHVFSRR
ncbi:MAG: antirestriction protein ArdA [Crinalium sp.]